MQFDPWTPPGLGLVSGPESSGRRQEKEEKAIRRMAREDDVTSVLRSLVEDDPYFTARGGTNRQPRGWQRHDPIPAAGVTRQPTHVKPAIRRAP